MNEDPAADRPSPLDDALQNLLLTLATTTLASALLIARALLSI